MTMIKNNWYWGKSSYLWLFRFSHINGKQVYVYECECCDEESSKEYGNKEIPSHLTNTDSLTNIREATQEEVLKRYKYAFDNLEFQIDLI